MWLRREGFSLASAIARPVSIPGKRASLISTFLASNPEFRRQGLGNRLMLEAMGRLRENGFERVELDMDSLNSKALPLYEQLDFREQEAITIYRRQITV